MSRHRLVKQLDLAEELDDDALDQDEGEDYDMDAEQRAQMESGVQAVQAVLGSQANIPERDIREALWNFYFDVDQSIESLLEEKHRKEAAEAKKQEAKRKKAAASTPTASGRATPVGTPKKTQKKKVAPVSTLQADVEALGLDSGRSSEAEVEEKVVQLPKEEILREIERRQKEGKPVLSLVVIGHVDAGKSTLMGRVLHDLGEITDRSVESNQRQSQKMGKGSFAYAWTFDALPEERERGVTIDIAVDNFSTEHRQFTLIDAPGHRDFIPNMISGATQADTALLVVDASSGAFEAGFGENGQTREHALLVRSLGVQQIVVAVNKLDVVGWSEGRYTSICEQLRPFLVSIGFAAAKVSFAPCAAMAGENIARCTSQELKAWYDGPTLVQQLDSLSVPTRSIQAALRLPLSNVFKSQTSGPSGLGASGRIESGVLQVGESVAVLPSDQVATIKNIEVDAERVPWAVAGQNVTVYLSNLDPIYLASGCVLCPPDNRVPLVTTFEAQIIVFDLKFPLTSGAAVELFHHSKEIPATISKLNATIDKVTGTVLKQNPRMLSSGSSARVQIKLRSSASSTQAAVVPLEPFTTNKSMGRILLRRGGETVGAGVVLSL